MKASYNDAKLILKLYDVRREDRLREARKWFTASFKVKTYGEFTALCPPGSETNASYRMVVTYWEMVASFLTSGVLNPELFYQSGRELLFCWERVRDILPAVREAYGHTRELKNLELAAAAYIKWWNKVAPGAYDAFGKRIRG
ncbi:MAG: hypothetical protein HY048_09885 [Acidobacteria bacterium]|nr:hypothetical protein [Acidobacteriota bacterium]